MLRSNYEKRKGYFVVVVWDQYCLLLYDISLLYVLLEFEIDKFWNSISLFKKFAFLLCTAFEMLENNFSYCKGAVKEWNESGSYSCREHSLLKNVNNEIMFQKGSWDDISKTTYRRKKKLLVGSVTALLHGDQFRKFRSCKQTACSILKVTEFKEGNNSGELLEIRFS